MQLKRSALSLSLVMALALPSVTACAADNAEEKTDVAVEVTGEATEVAEAVESAEATEDAAASAGGEADSATEANPIVFNVLQADKDYEQIHADAMRFQVKPERVMYVKRPTAYRELTTKLNMLTQDFKGKLGIAVFDQDGVAVLRDDNSFPLMSVVKFPLAYVVGQKMAERGDNLDTMMTIKVGELDSNTHSPMYDLLKSSNFTHIGDLKVADAPSSKDDPNAAAMSGAAFSSLMDRELKIPLRTMISYAVGQSDNNACDLLMTRYLDSPKELEDRLRKLGLAYTNVGYTEGQMLADTELSYGNGARPYDMAKFFAIYLNDKDFDPEVRKVIDEGMFFAPSGKTRIQEGVRISLERSKLDLNKLKESGELELYNKTGLGGTNSRGERIAVNDLAYVRLHDEGFIIAAFASDIPGEKAVSVPTAEQVVQKVVALIFDYLQLREDEPSAPRA